MIDASVTHDWKKNASFTIVSARCSLSKGVKLHSGNGPFQDDGKTKSHLLSEDVTAFWKWSELIE
jgi:hypothetical protein